jgi:hypothetical protein
LHHIPDYHALIANCNKVLQPQGVFFSFQDPMRFDTLGAFNNAMSKAAYLSWRIAKGDVIEGAKRRFRRNQGVYLEDSYHDNAEYHCVRNGVDQVAIMEQLTKLGFETEVTTYFATNSPAWQSVGTASGARNTFSVLALRTCNNS